MNNESMLLVSFFYYIDINTHDLLTLIIITNHTFRNSPNSTDQTLNKRMMY